MTDEKPVILARYAARKAHQVAGAMDALAEIMRRRARFRAEADERKLDEVLDRLADAGKAADQDDSYPAGVGERSRTAAAEDRSAVRTFDWRSGGVGADRHAYAAVVAFIAQLARGA
jgi:hypothetical protein